MRVIQTEITDPEVLAMLQAFYSRSHLGVESRIADLGTQEDRIKNSLKTYYLGYGHDSIGDCGWATLFIEDVSMLAAKAIQHHPLYNGQEKSTRYLNFQSPDPFYHPQPGRDDIAAYYQQWLELYQFIRHTLLLAYRQHVPQLESESTTAYENALACATFDVCRGFLPAGTKTSLSWTSPLRIIREHSIELAHHPLLEVRELAHHILKTCHQRYPSTFAATDGQPTPASLYMELCARKERRMLYSSMVPDELALLDFYRFDTEGVKRDMIGELQQRPAGAALPRYINHYGTITGSFWLDFGSFRDLQRHRNGTINIPEFRLESGFHPYYTEGIIKELFLSHDYEWVMNQVYELWRQLFNFQEILHEDDMQYLYPLGWRVPVQYTATLPQWVYMVKLRCKKTVHATLRDAMLQIADQLERRFSLDLGVDYGPSEWVTRQRGMQTIWRKDEPSPG